MTKDANLAEMYSNRRKRLAGQIDQGIALISSPGVAPDPSLFDKNLTYLTGLTSKDAVLVLAPNGIVVDRRETHTGPEVGRGRKVNELLFIKERSDREKMMDGEGDTIQGVRALTGVGAAYGLDKMNEILGPAFMREEQLWLNTPSNPRLAGPLPAEIAWINQIRDRYYWLKLRNIAQNIHELRRIKEPYEIDCLRRAFAIHAEIFEKIMRSLKPGVNESLGQAIFDHDVTIQPPEITSGLDLYASSIIVAAGKNATIAHYMDNNQEIKDGDLVLIDAGVACSGYYSDISATFPANGRFSPRQRELYAIVLEAQKKAIATMKPGATAFEAHKAVYDHFNEHGMAQYGYGTCGHPVGLSIHDPNGAPDTPYDPGVVLVIEPFLSIPDEEIAIRIESGVLITGEGYELLAGPPTEIEEVEALCQS